MITIEVEAVVRCDKCRTATAACSVPVQITAKGIIGALIDDMTHADDWSVTTDSHYRRYHTCPACTQRPESVVYG